MLPRQNSAAPDWTTQAEEIYCPLCEYNLRGLINQRCPECGHQFSWQKLLDPSNKKHPYLFEHHPKRNFYSFFRTFLAGLLPRRFWSTLQPVQPVLTRRLLFYALICLVLIYLVYIQCFSIDAIRHEYWYASRWGYRSTSFSIKSVLDQFPWFPSRDVSILQWIAVTLGWPILSFVVLMIFQGSMRRIKIRPKHILRCIVYSSDVFVWWSIPAMFIGADLLKPWLSWPDFVHLNIGIPTIAFELLFAYRMYQAYRRYLNFHQPFATIFCSQIIVFLILFTALLFTDSYIMQSLVRTVLVLN